jgi:hypothetical protein
MEPRSEVFIFAITQSVEIIQKYTVADLLLNPSPIRIITFWVIASFNATEAYEISD